MTNLPHPQKQYLDRIAALEEQVETLQEEIRQAKQRERGDGIDLPIEWGLTNSEETVVRCLLSRDQWRKEALHEAVDASHGPNHMTEPKIVDVYICKARAKLKPFGIEIKTIWGKGYSIDAETRARFAHE